VDRITSPNQKQQKLIENTEGIYLADAGAGTGKTFTITRRYVNLLEKGVDPEDIFLATYTRNAADEMMERIMKKSDVPEARIFDAAISTFHSHCQKILEKNGIEAPKLIGIETEITDDMQLMESQIREGQEFQSFYQSFREQNPEYQDFYRLVREPSNLLDLIKSLASKGVIPEKNGWFKDTEKYLEGDRNEFVKIFEEMNRPQEGKNGKKQSKLRGKLSRFDYKTYLDDAPEKSELRGDRGTKSIRRDFCEKAFDEDRDELKDFVHDIYFGYISYCLERNYLNFSFLMMFTYLLLYEKPLVRREESFDYLMIDEFQDTNEIQFKLALLMADKPNICAVGDWKQSIYSFQYAEVENIQEFSQRIQRFKDELNKDSERVIFDVGKVEKIALEKNYRSTQDILDLSEVSLELEGNRYEEVEKQQITSLQSEKDSKDSTIEKFRSEDEAKAILSKIQKIVEDSEYTYGDGKEKRDIGYDDIAVLTRTRSLGLELQQKARENGIPAAYEAGLELFKTNPSIVLLAWLRIINSNSRRGWAVVLEKTGYNIEEAQAIVKSDSYPDDMKEFKKQLENEENLKSVSRKVFNRYGYSSAVSERIIEVLTDTFNSSFMNTGQIIRFIEENIEQEEIYEVDNSVRENTVKIQTIHAAKGLEYPVVFVSGVNNGVFPSRNFDRSNIIYNELIGLRQKKIYNDGEYAYNYDNWRTEILTRCVTGSYDEERRLMYVAMTRAEQHLFVTAKKDRESRFYSGLDIPEVEVEPVLEEVEVEDGEHPVLRIEEMNPQ
jgi:superfamily I DNA/RNA helicase